jgi:hypothetical protein
MGRVCGRVRLGGRLGISVRVRVCIRVRIRTRRACHLYLSSDRGPRSRGRLGVVMIEIVIVVVRQILEVVLAFP